ncbi:hypothetical protein GW17_00036870 [Ensete ventricosum]|nr:hypothetical protein GW17_00036870 [Ensete ventricosum]
MTLREIAQGWYSRLPPALIRSFDQLAREFDANFLASARLKPTVVSLLGMRRKEDEPLGPYLAYFTKKIRVIPNTHLLLVIQAFFIGIKPSRFFWLLVEHPRQLRMERAEQTVPRLPNTPLNSTRIEIFLHIREKELLKAPNPMRTQFEECDRGRYYCFHRNYGHDTKEFYDLKNQIENLIYRDHLDRYVRKPREPSLRPKGPVERQIDIIVGGLATRGDNSSARKAYTRAEV